MSIRTAGIEDSPYLLYVVPAASSCDPFLRVTAASCSVSCLLLNILLNILPPF